MKRLRLVAFLPLLLPGCAALDKVMGAVKQGTEHTSLGKGLTELENSPAAKFVRELRASQARCAEFRTRPVPYEEEVQVGGAVALALADSTNGVYVEIAPALVPVPKIDPAAWANKKLAPANGPKTDLNQYLNKLGKSLAAGSSRPDIDWTFVVLDSPTSNAFSAPGGYVFVTTAMLREVKNEAQLAGVLAHEIGHVTGRHALKAYAESKVDSCNWAFAAEIASAGLKKVTAEVQQTISQLPGDIGDLTRSLGGGALNLDKMTADFINHLAGATASALKSRGNDQKDEFAADHDGFELMAFAGYDPKEFEELLRGLKGGGNLTPHPTGEARADKLKALREGEYQLLSFGAHGQPDNSKELALVKK